MADRTFKIKKNRENTIKVLKVVIDTLNKYNIKYYLDFGTLIGAIREKGLIPWDDDIDISLLNEQDYEKIPKLLEEIKNNYKLRTYLFTFKSSREKREKRKKKIHTKNINFTDENNFQIAKIRDNNFFIFGRGNTCIDIFFKYKFNNNLYWMAYGKENFVPANLLSEELIEIKFCGIKCTIPKEYDKYLTYKYGDWKVPNENWTHENDDFSIKGKK